MDTLFNISKDKMIFPIGKGFGIKIINEDKLDLYRHGILDRKVVFKTKLDRRIFVCQMLEGYKVRQKSIAEAMGFTAKTIRTWLTLYSDGGPDALQNSSKTGVGRKKKTTSRPMGDKFKEADAQRKVLRDEKKAYELQQQLLNSQGELEFDFKTDDELPTLSSLFTEEYDWQNNRYAGSFLYLALIEQKYKAIRLFNWLFKDNAVIIILFVLMNVLNIGSIEQLKTVYKHELGKLLGINKLFSHPVLWKKIHSVVKTGRGEMLKNMIFKTQIAKGLVSLWYLFIDGHFIPYTGKEKVHKNYHTQVDKMEPGQNEIFIHDIQGRIVYFEIQEGKGDMIEVIRAKSKEYSALFNNIPPLFVVDRELWGVERFKSLSKCRFITWEKNTSKEQVNKIDDKLFDKYLNKNDKEYQLTETRKKYSDNKGNSIELRRIIFWNTKTNHRTVAVTNDIYEPTHTLAAAMLNRWGKSENGFKHMGNRLNMHYNPVFDVSELSEKQQITNPQYLKWSKQKSKLLKEIDKIKRELADKPLTLNKDGSLRKNTSRDNLISLCKQKQVQTKQLAGQLKECPEQISALQLDENKQYKKIATEGKTLWDISETLVWNTRKLLEKMLEEFLPNKRDLLPVLDAITRSKGRIKSTKDYIYVEIEELERPAFRQAQQQLINKMNSTNQYLLNNKKIKFYVKNFTKKG